jgi:hypothetical protein
MVPMTLKIINNANVLAADTIAFTEGGAEAMRIDSDGDVGINTTSPETKLHVKGTSNTVSPIKVQGLSTNGTNLFSDRATSTESFVNLGAQWSNAGMVLGSMVKPSTTSDSDATGYISSYGGGSVKRSAILLDGGSGIIKFLNTDTSATVAVDTAVAMSERMRITSDGLVGIENNSPDVNYNLTVGITSANTKSAARFNRGTTSNTTNIAFANPNGVIGTVNTSGSSTSYNTSSDYRLKENVSYEFDATTRLKQLKPARFNFKADANKTVDGFLAHEVQSVIPEAITGIKDETETKEKVVVNNIGNVIAENIEQADWEAGKITNEEGKSQYPIDSTWEASKVVPVYQGIDQAKLTPILTKALQEAIARIESLEATTTSQQTKIDALEARLTALESN